MIANIDLAMLTEDKDRYRMLPERN